VVSLSLLLLAAAAFSTHNRVMLRTTAEALRSAEKLAFAQALELKESDEREAMLRREAAMRKDVQAFNDQLFKSVKVFGSMIDGLAGASQILNKAASQARESSGNVADASNRAAHHVADVAAAADHLASAASDITEKALESSSIFHETAKDAEATNNAVESFNHAVLQIDSVVGSIQEIADQTNLLALNATIEAARAGEAGRGFSVVAAEVKALANQTSRATQDIRTQISAIQQAGAASIRVLQSIRTQILAVEEISNYVKDAVTTHGSSAREIASTIRVTAKESEAVSLSAKALAQATELSCKSVADVISLAHHLDNEAKRISSEADHFFKTLQLAQDAIHEAKAG
jgi:methyl-accepting chemotaxis protein